jgi:hypothetical protein
MRPVAVRGFELVVALLAVSCIVASVAAAPNRAKRAAGLEGLASMFGGIQVRRAKAITLCRVIVCVCMTWHYVRGDWRREWMVAMASTRFQGGDCQFKCKDGSAGVQKSGYKPSTNGCGVAGLSVKLGDHDFTDCCNAHDVCYGSCGESKTLCDTQFKVCMTMKCKDTSKSADSEETCRSNADLYFLGVNSMGCRAYQDSQKEACDCGSGGAAPSQVWICGLHVKQLPFDAVWEMCLCVCMCVCVVG